MVDNLIVLDSKNCVKYHIIHKLMSVGHPQSNGEAEVTNRMILEGLKTRLDRPKVNGLVNSTVYFGLPNNSSDLDRRNFFQLDIPDRSYNLDGSWPTINSSRIV